MCFNQELFGKRIQQLRLAKGMTQDALAERANTDRSHIAKIEKGTRSFSIDLLIVFANVFHVSTDYLLFGQCDKETTKTELLLVLKNLTEMVERL